MPILSLEVLEEKVKGPLADALKNMNRENTRDFTSTTGLVRMFKEANIDFNRSVGKSKEVKSGRDPRLTTPGNIIIAVFRDADANVDRITAHQVGNTKNFSARYARNINVTDKNGDTVLVKSFSSLPWAKWLSVMHTTYIIEEKDVVYYSDTINAKAQKRMERNKLRDEDVEGTESVKFESSSEFSNRILECIKVAKTQVKKTITRVIVSAVPVGSKFGIGTISTGFDSNGDKSAVLTNIDTAAKELSNKVKLVASEGRSLGQVTKSLRQSKSQGKFYRFSFPGVVMDGDDTNYKLVIDFLLEDNSTSNSKTEV